MASESAMRAGAGYVTALVPASLNLVFETRLLEVMSVPLPDAGGSLAAAAAETVLGRVERADALVLGPGLGREPEALGLARDVAAAAEVPLLLDADGLNAHAGKLSSLARRARADGPDSARGRARAAAGVRQRRGRRQAFGQRPASSRSDRARSWS